MSENSLLHHFFPEDGTVVADERFGLTRKSRSARLREISRIVRKHKFSKGFTPEQFRDFLQDLGPSFVKIGQTLSLRSEILPPAYREALSSLQMECQPLPFDLVVEALEKVYGERFSSIFKEIDPKPLGSASVAQVHKATLSNGDQVAVKIQRPGVRASMAQDIDIMRSMARKAQRFVKEGQIVDLVDVVEELWKTFLEETDFTKEAENLEEFAFLNKDTVFIGCPLPYLEYCSEEVLVMEYIEGISIRDKDRLLEMGYDLEEIGTKVIDNYASQILDHGFFHADPHPGNIFVKEGKVYYLDLGIAGRLSPRDRAGFGAIVEAVGMKSAGKLKDALISFSISHDLDQIDHPRLLAELDIILSSYGSVDIADIDIGAMLTEVLSLTKQCKVVMPPSVTSVVRGIVIVEGTLADYIANSNIIQIINDHIRGKKETEEELKTLMREMLVSFNSAGQGLVTAAESSGEVIKMLSRGQLKMNMEFQGSDEPIAKISRIANRLTVSVIIAGLMVSGAAVSTMEPQVLGVSVLSFIQFVSAFILSGVVVFDIYRKPRRK